MGSQALPDLVVQAVFASDPLAVGQSFLVSMIVKNQGLAPAGSFRMTWYLSTDQTFSPDDEEIASCSLNGLGVGLTGLCDTVVPSLRTYGNVAPGPHYVLGVVDASGVRLESDETNNILWFGPVTVN